ncbi:MAG TPA: 2-amino-4-hydroxy-6-hydroxymethyldihydropteridine diphosphokinase [Acidimicrobiia bacterium]|nr:2-amino-4-hydroxy-6-hydroxymethyldihydropteridine diphosphokinase [Acidimicrobiia bacterium]
MRAYLALGSNEGDRPAHLRSAVAGFAEADGVEVVAVSRVYETDPVGGPAQGAFLNAVVAVETTLDPHALLALGQALERRAGRLPEGERVRWGPRPLDVDLLLVGDLTVASPDLAIPHPRMWERDFVLAPLADVAPELVDVPAAGWQGVRPTDVELS